MLCRRCIEPLFLGLLILASHWIASPAHANTLLVPEDLSFESALSTAALGDTVSVASGTLEYGSVPLPPGIVLLSREPWTNSISRLLAWDLSEPSEVRGFLFTAYPYWQQATAIWLGVVVDNSEVSFVECHFEGLDSEMGDGDGIEFPREWAWRWPLDFSDGSKVSFSSCEFRENLSNGNDYYASSACIASVKSSVEIFNCIFENQGHAIYSDGSAIISGSRFRECRDLVVRAGGSLWMLGSLFVGCGPRYWETPGFLKDGTCEKTPSILLSGSVHLYRNTFVDNPVRFPPYYQWCREPFPQPDDRLALVILDPASQGSIEQNLFVGLTGPAVDAPAAVEVSCNDAWDGLGRLWVGGIGDVTGIDGNISEAPIFCGRNEGDYTISVQSPAANAACGLMGAFPVACDTKLEIPIDGGDVPEGQPASLRTRLLGAAPNPFNPRTQIRFELAHPADARLEIFDVAGRLVRSWSWSRMDAGPHAIAWNAHDGRGDPVASGVYHLRLLTGGKSFSRAVALLR